MNDVMRRTCSFAKKIFNKYVNWYIFHVNLSDIAEKTHLLMVMFADVRFLFLMSGYFVDIDLLIPWCLWSVVADEKND